AARNQAMSELAADVENTQNALVEFNRIKTLLAQGTGDQREYDDRRTTYEMDMAQVSAARAALIQATAEVAHAKADLARSIADLGTPGPDNPRLRRAEANLQLAQQNLDFTKVQAPVDGYVTNLQLRAGDSAVTNQPIVAIIDAHSFY